MNCFKSLIGLSVGVMIVSLAAGCGNKRDAGSPNAAVVSGMNQGVSLMGQYNYDRAVKAFSGVLEADPALIDAKVNLAIARFNRARKEDRDIEQAGELLDGVLKSEPGNVRAWYFKGIVLQHIGQTEAAIACFEKVVQQRPDDGAAWYLLGMCKQRLGQKADRELLQAIQLRPYLGSAYYKLWQTYQADGQAEKATPYLEKFKQLRENPLNETIELPQYNQMGELALVQPLPPRPRPPITKATYKSGLPQKLFESRAAATPTLPSAGAGPAGMHSAALGGVAVGDFNHDGILDLVFIDPGETESGKLVLLLSQPGGAYVQATAGSGLEGVRGARNGAVGDFDNDELVDLFVTANPSNHLFRGKGDGTFIDVTQASGLSSQTALTQSALFLDADHDGDLDLFVASSGPGGNQLWSNNTDGTFTNVAASAAIACSNSASVMVLPGDLDGDRDMDLVIVQAGQPARVFLNDLLAAYHEVKPTDTPIHGDLGGVLQDFNGDGHLDLLVLGGRPARLRLFLGDGTGRLRADAAFDSPADAAASWGELRGFRVADLDLDGDLDVAVFSTDGHELLNDGSGRFVLQPQVWKFPAAVELTGVELMDLDRDSVPDLFYVERGAKNQVVLLPGTLTPPSTALAITPTGMRGRDKRTRSPASGYGATLTVRAGLSEASRWVTGQFGGFNQSETPVTLGLGGVRQADYLRILWPDGVAQVEVALAAGQPARIVELQRKTSSCPVLFAWNGERFKFITDFAGVGGLGYFIAPGEYAQPQVLEHVKIEPAQLRPRDGVYELRVTEPMEEAAYVDQLELWAIDHPAGWLVFPDERLAVTGPPPTHELLVVNQPIFARRALDPEGHDCAARLVKADRRYAYQPKLDRRFFGFCRPHTLELDLGDQLADLKPEDRVFLFLNGYLEYPYSQTAYAASQARVVWQPIRIERLAADGRWEAVIPDAGAFGGMARTMTVDMTGRVGGPSCRLRLTSNLELYYDQIFLARDAGRSQVAVHALPLRDAEFRRVGFAREYSPDGQMPLIYDYELTEPTAPFDVLRGAYTRYGAVKELLGAFDDQYVVMGPGDEIALKFDAGGLSLPGEGQTRSFVLVSRAYCKDMDLYTATPRTLEPLPFQGMSRYPYSPPEHYPATDSRRHYRQTYNTRIVE